VRTDIYQFEDLGMAIFGMVDPEAAPCRPVTDNFATMDGMLAQSSAAEQGHAAWLLQRAAATLNGG